jgi:hypothetical protein
MAVRAERSPASPPWLWHRGAMTRAKRTWIVMAAGVAVVVLGAALVLVLRPAASPSSPAATSGPVASGRAAAVTAVPVTGRAGYSFGTLGDPRDATFNRLTGISNRGHISGYFGSAAAGHPSQGFILRPPYAARMYQDIDFPHSAQTQLNGLNEQGIQVGSYSVGGGQAGFYLMNGHYSAVRFPTGDNASPPVNRLLGVNNSGIAVGFYTDAGGSHHGYRYNIATRQFSAVSVPGASSVTAAAISNTGSVAGFFTGPAGATSGFLLLTSGQLVTLTIPHATVTEALGVNDSGEVVGTYQLGRGGMATRHGFTWTQQQGFTTVDDPDGRGTTTISGVSNAGELVGSYLDRTGHTDGLLATPDH